MAEWIPPKTNWQGGDIPGAGDFNRIEGNTEYLKQKVDTTRFKKGTVTINPNDQAIVTHNLNSMNVLVDIALVSNRYAGFIEVAPSGVYYRIINANQVALFHSYDDYDKFIYTIIRLDW